MLHRSRLSRGFNGLWIGVVLRDLTSSAHGTIQLMRGRHGWLLWRQYADERRERTLRMPSSSQPITTLRLRHGLHRWLDHRNTILYAHNKRCHNLQCRCRLMQWRKKAVQLGKDEILWVATVTAGRLALLTRGFQKTVRAALVRMHDAMDASLIVECMLHQGLRRLMKGIPIANEQAKRIERFLSMAKKMRALRAIRRAMESRAVHQTSLIVAQQCWAKDESKRRLRYWISERRGGIKHQRTLEKAADAHSILHGLRKGLRVLAWVAFELRIEQRSLQLKTSELHKSLASRRLFRLRSQPTRRRAATREFWRRRGLRALSKHATNKYHSEGLLSRAKGASRGLILRSALLWMVRVAHMTTRQRMRMAIAQEHWELHLAPMRSIVSWQVHTMALLEYSLAERTIRQKVTTANLSACIFKLRERAQRLLANEAKVLTHREKRRRASVVRLIQWWVHQVQRAAEAVAMRKAARKHWKGHERRSGLKELSTHAALRKAYRKACTHISGQAWEHWTKGYVRLCHEEHARTRLALSFLKRSGLRRWRSAPRRSAEEIRLALEASDWQEMTSVKWLLRRWRDAIARRRVTVHLIALFKRIQSFQYWQWRAQSKLRIRRMQAIAKHVATRKARKKVLRRLRALASKRIDVPNATFKSILYAFQIWVVELTLAIRRTRRDEAAERFRRRSSAESGCVQLLKKSVRSSKVELLSSRTWHAIVGAALIKWLAVATRIRPGEARRMAETMEGIASRFCRLKALFWAFARFVRMAEAGGVEEEEEVVEEGEVEEEEAAKTAADAPATDASGDDWLTSLRSSAEEVVAAREEEEEEEVAAPPPQPHAPLPLQPRSLERGFTTPPAIPSPPNASAPPAATPPSSSSRRSSTPPPPPLLPHQQSSTPVAIVEESLPNPRRGSLKIIYSSPLPSLMASGVASANESPVAASPGGSTHGGDAFLLHRRAVGPSLASSRSASQEVEVTRLSER